MDKHQGKQRSGSEHLSLSSGTSPNAFICLALPGELQLPTVISIKLPAQSCPALSAREADAPGRHRALRAGTELSGPGCPPVPGMRCPAERPRCPHGHSGRVLPGWTRTRPQSRLVRWHGARQHRLRASCACLAPRPPGPGSD
ncbi:unnamed protein product [Coccothraustes coccothraustes]